MSDHWVWVCLVPAGIGWLLNQLAAMLVIRHMKQQLSLQLEQLGAGLLGPAAFRDTITAPDNVQRIMPLVNTHVDEFLRVKLPAKMPVIGMFVGDKTIAELKTVFVAELETLFPVIMGGFADSVQDAGLGSLLARPAEQLKTALVKAVRRRIWLAGLVGALIGLLAGVTALLLG